MVEWKWLKKGGVRFYPRTHLKVVDGLDVATVNSDGLLPKSDKAKLDKLQVEPFDGLKFKSPDGSIFVLSVSDEGKSVFTKEGG